MAEKSPEQELDEFLASKPSWLRKFLQCDYSFTPEEIFAMQKADWWWQDLPGDVDQEFLRLLRRCPGKWNEYCNRRKENALRDVPSKVSGRPAKNALAQEAIELKKSLSYAKVAKQLNQKYGLGTTTEGAIRQLIRSRRASDAES